MSFINVPRSSRTIKTLFWIFIFAVTMAFFESALVIYLRELYYPQGFSFPLTQVPFHIGLTEIIREACAMLMVLSVAWLSGNRGMERFAFFCIIFGIWDIFYYIFLKIILGWPESFFTWDILFLIPAVWSGPVIAPLIISIILIIFGNTILVFEIRTGGGTKLPVIHIALFLSGAAIVFLSFILEFLLRLNTAKPSMSIINSVVPENFPWIPFILGITGMISSIVLIILRNANRA